MFGFGFLFIFWLLGITGMLGIGGTNHIIFILFILLFCLPGSLYCGFLTIDHTPLVTMYEDRIVFHSHFLPWREYTMLRDNIISCSTNWEGSNSESRCDLVIEVEDELLQSFYQNRVVWKKKDRLYFEFSTAKINPYKGVELINEYLSLKKEDLDTLRWEP